MIHVEDKSLQKRHVEHIQNRAETQANLHTLSSADNFQSCDPPSFNLHLPMNLVYPVRLTHRELLNNITQIFQVSVWRNPTRTRRPPKSYQSEQT